MAVLFDSACPNAFKTNTSEASGSGFFWAVSVLACQFWMDCGRLTKKKNICILWRDWRKLFVENGQKLSEDVYHFRVRS